MQKKINKLFVSIILINIFYLPVVNGYQIYNLKASQVHHIDDVDSIDWTGFEVGDTVDIETQVLDQFNNYKFVNLETMFDLVNYDPDTATVNVETDSARDRREAIFEPEYQLDINQGLKFGTRFYTDVSGSTLANKGYIKVMSRPNYLRTNSFADWGASSTDENSWIFSQDNKQALKYMENGNIRNTQTISGSATYNTLSISIDPEANVSVFKICNLPKGDTTYDCGSSAATDKQVITQKVESKYFDNQFISIAYSPGVQKANSMIHIEGIKTEAVVESYGEVVTTNPVVYVPLGTSLEQAHELADPKYNEFIDYVVTAVNRDVAFSDLASDGGYNPNAVGNYLFTYNVTTGYEGAAATGTVEIQVVDPSQLLTLTGSPATVPTKYAPKTDEDIKQLLNVAAATASGEPIGLEQVKISNYGGYTKSSPKAGVYNIQFYVKDPNGIPIYQTFKLTVVDNFNLDDLTVKQSLEADANSDGLVSSGEVISVAVVIENTTGSDLTDSTFTYAIDSNHFVKSQITNIKGDASSSDLSDNKIILNKPLKAGAKLEFEYDVTARDSFIIGGQTQDMNNATNVLTASAYGLSSTKNLKLQLDKDFISSFTTDFTAVDASGNELLSTGESVSATATFNNSSDYNVDKITFSLKDKASKLSLNGVEVTSNKRTLSADDFTVQGNLVTVLNVTTDEVLTITYDLTALNKFSNTNPANLVMSFAKYGSNDVLVGSHELSQTIDIDIASVSDLHVSSALTDSNDQKINPGESFEVEFEIANTGSLTEQKLKVDIDTSDLNIENSYKNITDNNVEMVFKTDGNITSGTYTIQDNVITIDKLAPGQSVAGVVHFRANWSFDGSDYVENPLDFAITSNTQITSASGFSLTEDLAIPINTSNAYINSNLNVRELEGDGDNKIDSNEVFEFKNDIAIDGSVPVPGLQVVYNLDTNNIAEINGVTFKVICEGQDVTDQMLFDGTTLTIPNAKQGQHYNVYTYVTYGTVFTGNTSNNTIVTKHPYINDIERQSNIAVDTSNLKKVSLEANITQTEVAAGDHVNVLATVKNEGATNEENLKLKVTGDNTNLELDHLIAVKLNGGELTEGADYTLDRNQITVKKLNAGQTITIEFDIKVADVFTIDPAYGTDDSFDFTLTGELADQKTKTIDFTVSPTISTVAYDTALSVAPYIGTAAHTDDYLVYTYSLTNGNQLNLTNNTIKFDLSDPELTEIIDITVTSDDKQFDYQKTDNGVVFNNLAVNKSATVSFVVKTSKYFNTSPDITAAVDLESDFTTKNNQVTIAKDLAGESKISVSSNLNSTSSGNLLVGSDEEIFYTVSIENEGSVIFDDLTVASLELNSNFTSEELVSITDQDGNEYSKDKYTLDGNNQLQLLEFAPNEQLDIMYRVDTNSDNIAYDPDLNITTVVRNDLVSETTILPLAVDLSHVGKLVVDYSLEETASDRDGKVDPGEVNYINVSIENTDFIAIEDVVVTNTLADPNLTADFANVVVTDKAGNKLEAGIDYEKTGDQIVIDSFPGNEKYNFRYKITANDKFTATNFATISATVQAVYPGSDTNNDVFITPYQAKFPLDRADNMDYQASVELTNKNGSEQIAPGDSLEAIVTIENTGKIDLSDVEVIYDLQPNVDSMSIALLDRFATEIDNNKIIVSSVKAGETVSFKMGFKMKNTFNSDTRFNLTGSVNSRLMQIAIGDSMPIDQSGAQLSTKLFQLSSIGDNDKLADPGETTVVEIDIENTGNILLENITVTPDLADNNISSSKFVSSNVDYNLATNQIDQLLPGQTAKLKFEVVLKHSFDSNQQIDYGVTVDQSLVDENITSGKIEIDIVNNSSLNSSLTVVDSDDSDTLAVANEQLTFTYNLQNTGQRDLSDVVLDLDTSDRNLDYNSFSYVASINGVETELNMTDMNFTIPTFKAGDRLELVYTINTSSTITNYNFLKTLLNNLNIQISSKIEVTTGDNSVNTSDLAQIDVSDKVAEIKVEAELTDQTNNKLLAADELYTYQIKLTNTGAVDSHNLVLRVSKSGANAGLLESVVITAKDGHILADGSDYAIHGNEITFSNLPIDEEYTVDVTFKASPTIDANAIVTTKAVVIPEVNNSQILSATIAADTAGRNIEYEITHKLDEYKPTDVVGKTDELYLNIENNGTVNEYDVKLRLHDYTTDFVFDPSTTRVEKNGQEYEDYVYNPATDTLILGEVASGDKIAISEGIYLDSDMNPRDPDADAYDISIYFDVTYADESSEETKQLDIDIPKTLLSDVVIESTLYETDANDSLASASESLTGQVVIENNNYLRQVKSIVEIAPDSATLDLDSYQLLSVTDASGNNIDSEKYQVSGNQIILNDFRYQDKWIITYQITTNSEFDFNQAATIEQMRSDIAVTVTDDIGQTETKYQTMKISPQISSLSLDGDVVADLDGKVSPGEDMTIVYNLENTGSLVQYDVLFGLDEVDSTLISGEIDKLIIKNTGASRLAKGVDYTVDTEAQLIRFTQINPGDKLEIRLEYKMPEIMDNAPTVSTSAYVVSNTNQTKRKYIFKDTDFTDSSQFTSTTSLTDANQDQLVQGQEQLSYKLKIDNNGNLNYMQIGASIDLSKAHGSVDPASIVFTRDGQIDESIGYTLTADSLQFEASVIDVGEVIELEFNYQIANETGINSQVDTLLTTDSYSQSHTNRLLTSETSDLEVDGNYAPVITGFNNLTISEGSSLNDDELTAQIGATATDYEDGDLTVTYDLSQVKLDAPGTYNVVISAIDSKSKQTTAEAKVTVEDLKPTIVLDSSLKYIELGSTATNFISLFNATASEVTKGDLTDNFEISHEIDFNRVGTYPVTFTVVDDEGNVAHAVATVAVVRDLSDPTDVIDNTVDGNYPPVITASDIVMLENNGISESAFIGLANVAVSDYEDSNQDLSVTVDHDIAFDEAGTYNAAITVADSGNKTATAEIQVEIIDVLPVVTSAKTEASIVLGNSKPNYASLYGIVASEISNGDLTPIIDDSQVNYQVTGTYLVYVTTKDNEGNISDIVELSLNIVRDLDFDGTTDDLEVDVIAPIISGNTSASIGEEQQLSTSELVNLFDIDYNQGSHLALTIDDRKIDYNTPGSYPIVFTNTDVISNQAVTVNGLLTVVDLKPTVSSTVKSQTVALGATDIDYVASYGIVATEVNSGDLRPIIDDSAVDLSATGSYPVYVTAEDNEGNTSAVLELTLNVERDAPESGKPLTPEVDVIKPSLTADAKASTSEGIILSEDDLVELFNVKYNSGFQLLLDVDDSQVDYMAPGSYQVIFTNTDLISGQTASKQATLIVDDVLPVVTSTKTEASIVLGDSKPNYTSLYGIVATEISNGDLTPTIDDSQVNYKVTGTYRVYVTAKDSEGNTSDVVELSLNIVRDIEFDGTTDDLEVDGNYPPVITGLNNLTISEGNSLSTDELIAQIGAVANDYEDGELEVTYDLSQINLDTPGNYEVLITATDSESKQATAVANVTVADLKPTIILDSNLRYIEVGSTDIDFSLLFGAVASEITKGDYTAEIEVSHEIDFNRIGTYPVTFTVTDDEGNVAHAVAIVAVVRDLSDPTDEIDNTVDGNYPPAITASNIVLSESNRISDSELIALANVAVSDYEDNNENLEVTITHNVTFDKAGIYNATLTVIDSGNKKAKVEIKIEVTDVLPVVTSTTDTASIVLGESNPDYPRLYGIVATEINRNDLEPIINDSNVNYNVTGTYPVYVSAVDNEGNESDVLELSLNIVRDIDFDVTPEDQVVDVTPPTLELEQSATVLEGQVLTDSELKDLFNAKYNSGSHLLFDVDQSAVDYATPGNYEVVFTNTDTISGTLVTKRVTLQVKDVLPSLQSNDKLVIERGEDVEDYLDQLNIVATELTSGDLTSQVIVNSSAINTSLVGDYKLLLSVGDDDGNTVFKTVKVEVVNTLSPVITSNDVTIDSELAMEITTIDQLAKYTNVVAIDYNGDDLSSQITIKDDDGFFSQKAYNNGDIFAIEYQVTNSDGRLDTTVSEVTIGNNLLSVEMMSNSPVVFSLDDNATLADITARARVRALVTSGDTTKVEYLTSADIVSTNYITGQTGLFMVKYQYQGAMQATHNVLVYITDDGVVADNDQIKISPIDDSSEIMPGQTYNQAFTITNNASRSKTMSDITVSSVDSNVSGIKSLTVTNTAGQVVDSSVSKNVRTINASLRDIVIPSGATYTITAAFETKPTFTYTKQVESMYSVTFDGETQADTVSTKVDKKAINTSVKTRLDKAIYHASEVGTIYLEIENSGTMDTKFSAVTADMTTTNIKMTAFRSNGLVVEDGSNIMIPAKSKTTIEVDFVVNDEVVLGLDQINLFDDLGAVINIEIPVEIIDNSEPEVEESSQLDGEESEVEESSQQDGEESEVEESSQQDGEVEDSAGEQLLKQMTHAILETGMSPSFGLIVASLIILVLIRRSNSSK